jgi:hypothetical protein
MPSEKKRADNVGSARSRKEGQQAQDEFTKMIEKLFGEIDAQLEVEPKGIKINADTINNMLNKKDKKKLN